MFNRLKQLPISDKKATSERLKYTNRPGNDTDLFPVFHYDFMLSTSGTDFNPIWRVHQKN